MRLLLVEDDPRLADLILEGLAEDGLTVEHAGDATAGLGLASLETFDAIILDVMLPEGAQAGFELARSLRDARQHTPNTMGFLNDVLGRPANERAFLILVVGKPAHGASVPAITKKPLEEIATFIE
jgi:CheY-like chemotaxis protein